MKEINNITRKRAIALLTQQVTMLGWTQFNNKELSIFLESHFPDKNYIVRGYWFWWRQRNKKTIRNTFIIAFIWAPVVWLVVSTDIQRFKCPSMTTTELFLNIPNSILGNWKNCN